MLHSVDAIDDFTVGLSFDSYRANLLIQSGVERQLNILAEAAFRLRGTIEILCPQVDWHAIYGLGNFLRHEYHGVCARKIWDSIQHELPPLASAVRRAVQSTIIAEQEQS